MLMPPPPPQSDISSTFNSMPEMLNRIRSTAIEITEQRRDDWQTGLYPQVSDAMQCNVM